MADLEAILVTNGLIKIYRVHEITGRITDDLVAKFYVNISFDAFQTWLDWYTQDNPFHFSTDTGEGKALPARLLAYPLARESTWVIEAQMKYGDEIVETKIVLFRIVVFRLISSGPILDALGDQVGYRSGRLKIEAFCGQPRIAAEYFAGFLDNVGRIFVQDYY